MFNQNFSKNFLDRLSLHMKELTLGPGEILFKKGDIDNRYFYVNKGDLD